MPSDDWYLTTDLDDFLARAGEFLRSRPARHTVPLTVTENLRTGGLRLYGDRAPEFGVLRGDGVTGVRAAFFRTPPHPLMLTALTEREADALAGQLAGAGQELPGVNADRDTAAAFAAAWQRRTGAGAVLDRRMRLYRLGELTVPRPAPPGRARPAGEGDRELLARWYGEFHTAIGESAVRPAADWARERARRGDILLWQTPDGAPAAMAGLSPKVAGQIRVNAVYTPAHLRGRGYAGAVTAAVSRAAVDAGAAEVLLFTDLANPTSNGLYQHLGYRPVTDFARYAFE
ncbi:GNAT family N-acetyltransferase [Streptomyces sennicomposti]|uniref:GNAT family N-acetyltransferase n=1 Tax=Streptomyces sennicomposti TaxID=2873384 RepID=UPI001CA7A042|nr:GNAT family N-acetyltransferase [Streptomyces sennicomposti]MBY8865959.1 GNAT family N-acetyltransferase [Streptomyces sennicomposti]